MGSTSTKTYQADFRFVLSSNGNLSWSASGGNWPWDVPYQPYLDSDGVFRVWRPQGENFNIQLESNPMVVSWNPVIAPDGIFDQIAFKRQNISGLVPVGAMIHEGFREINGDRVIIIHYTAIIHVASAKISQIDDFDFKFIAQTDTSNFDVRVNDAGILSYNNKELVGPTVNDLSNVTVSSFTNLNNAEGMFRLMVQISNLAGTLLVTYDNQYAPPVVEVRTDGLVLFVGLNEDVSQYRTCLTSNIITSGITVPNNLNFNIQATNRSFILTPSDIEGGLLSLIRPGEELGISFLFIILNK